MNPLNYVILFCVLALGLFLLWRWMKRTSQVNDAAFQRVILRDAADWLSGQLGEPADSIEQALRERLDNKATNPLVQRVLRIDVELTRTKPDACSQAVAVALRGDGDGVVVGKIAREVNWEMLPSEVRREFIVGGKKVQSFVLLNGGV